MTWDTCLSRAHAVGLLTLIAVFLAIPAGAAEATGLTGDVRYEQLGGSWPYWQWRGAGGDVWGYPDWVIQPGGAHISATYVHKPYPNKIHAEAGIIKVYGGTPMVYWAYNNHPSDLSYQRTEDYAAASLGAYNYLEVNNFDMGSVSPDEWRMAWNGHLMKKIDLDMLYGQVWISTERLFASGSQQDDRRTSIRNMKKKDSNGNWSGYQNCSQYPYYNDPLVVWDNYSATHWYSY